MSRDGQKALGMLGSQGLEKEVMKKKRYFPQPIAILSADKQKNFKINPG